MSHDYLCLIGIYVNGIFDSMQHRLYHDLESAKKELAIFGYRNTNVSNLFIKDMGVIVRRCHIVELPIDYTENDILSYVNMQ